MSIDNSVYIGAYIKVKKTTEKIEHFKMVNKSNNKRYGLDVKYDPKTGEKLVKKYVGSIINTNRPNPSITDDQGDIDDTFWAPEYIGCDEYTIFLPNYGNCGITRELHDIDDFDLGGLDYKSSIKKFNNDHKEYISYYENKFGKESVSTHYGVVLYSN